MNELLTWEWLEQAVRGFLVSYNRTVGSVFAEDWRVTVYAHGDTFAVSIVGENGESTSATRVKTRRQFVLLAAVHGVPLRGVARIELDLGRCRPWMRPDEQPNG